MISFDEFDTVGDDLYKSRVDAGWEKAGFPERWKSEVYRMTDSAFEDRFHFAPNSMQKEVISIINKYKQPGVYVLEAPMGTGKTEAALAAAEVIAHRNGNSGIFFGLPTQATSNGLFGRLFDWADQVSEGTYNTIRLAHGAAQFNEEYMEHYLNGNAIVDEDEEDEMLAVHPWFQGNKRALLADFVIGTVDQFLMASLKRKHFMLRHLGLAGKVIVIDECHAYDTFMNQYLDQSIKWMASYGITVILLSATLPSVRRKQLVDIYAKEYVKYHLGQKKPVISYPSEEWDRTEAYPLLTWSDGENIKQQVLSADPHKRKVELEWIDSDEEMIRLLQWYLAEGGCACVIVNTVIYAQKIYELLKECMIGFDVILYHAQYTITDRREKEKLLMRKMGKNSTPADRDHIILVGTQVLEQSLDYDADIMVSQVCPMDLLLQRIGRLHRHNNRSDRPERIDHAKCLILGEQGDRYDKGTAKVYGEYLLERTITCLPDHIVLPDDISMLVQKVYDEPKDSELENIIGLEDYKKKIHDQREKSRHYLLSRGISKTLENMLCGDDTTKEEYADTGVRDSDPSIEVLVMKKLSKGNITFITKSHGEEVISQYDVPNNTMGKRIAMERIRLPHMFCYHIRDTIEELERRNIDELSSWQKCPWLQGELLLLFDENNRTELGGYILSYTEMDGLVCTRKETR